VSTNSLDPSQSVDRQREQRIAAARRQWSQLPAADLERHGRYIVDKASGNLFTLTEGAVFPGGDAFGHGPEVDGFFVGSDGEPRYLTRSQSPSTLAELREQEDAKEAAQREREQEHDRFLRDQPTRTLRLCDLKPDYEMPTVREAARLLLAHHCRIEARDGRLVVHIPEVLHPYGPLHVDAL
jgi:hypothetical protein